MTALLFAGELDPNWFYSTAAQSTAAIVGLAGGFLAARLISHRADIAEERGPFRSTFLDLAERVSTALQFAKSAKSRLDPVLKAADDQVQAGTLGHEPIEMSDLQS